MTIQTEPVSTRTPARLALFVAVFSLAACSTMMSGGGKVSLSAAEEVPSNPSTATGSGTITIGADKSVSGSITTTGIVATAAHIHLAAAGKNGPIIVHFVKSGDHSWSIVAGAKLTDAQFESYKAGDLYINVHSAAYKGGEIRAQLKP